MADEKNIRAFLATDPPEEILREIAGVQGSLKRSLRGDIRWVRPEGIHLTLKFFGDISEADVRAIFDIVERQVASVAPMSFQLGELGAFPDYQHPRVIWVGLMGDISPLEELQKRLDQQFQTIGFPGEDRPFRAHLTLGRVKTAKGPIGLAQSVGAIRTTGRFKIGDLSLFRSQLSPQGASYTKLATFVFRG
jgi:2'-5' RNA ligase